MAAGCATLRDRKYVNKKYAETPREIKVSGKPKGKLTIECDEMWSFVKNKENQQWIRLAIDTKNREIVGIYVGDRCLRSSANTMSPG